MTALLGAMDKRVKATATACYLTTMDALLPSIGAQDAEQSIPDFIASGFDFADWVELAAPRAYAMVGTVSDMFPWKGFLQTATGVAAVLFAVRCERRKAWKQVSTSAMLVTVLQLPTPTGPTLNPDTANAIPASSPFQVIAGIGGHGNLRPITSQIVGYFLVHLAGRSADAFVAPPAQQRRGRARLRLPDVPAGALQVTPTGQVATSYPGARDGVHAEPEARGGEDPAVRQAANAAAGADGCERGDESGGGAGWGGAALQSHQCSPSSTQDNVLVGSAIRITSDHGVELTTVRTSSCRDGTTPGKHARRPAAEWSDLWTANSSAPASRMRSNPESSCLFTPRPSPPGGEETKSPILGPFYMTELRAELVGKTAARHAGR